VQKYNLYWVEKPVFLNGFLSPQAIFKGYLAHYISKVQLKELSIIQIEVRLIAMRFAYPRAI